MELILASLAAWLKDSVLVPVVFEVCMKVVKNMQSDPEFAKKCEEVFAKSLSAKSQEELLNVSSEIQNLLKPKP